MLAVHHLSYDYNHDGPPLANSKCACSTVLGSLGVQKNILYPILSPIDNYASTDRRGGANIPKPYPAPSLMMTLWLSC